jgi:hypothetical protein
VGLYYACEYNKYIAGCHGICIYTFRHHAWTSFESWAEIYNEVHQESTASRQTVSFFRRHPLKEVSGMIDQDILMMMDH